MRTIFALASIALVAVIMGTSVIALPQAMAQSGPTCLSSTSTTLSWVIGDALEGDPDINANGFICVLNYTIAPIPRITIDDLG